MQENPTGLKKHLRKLVIPRKSYLSLNTIKVSSEIAIDKRINPIKIAIIGEIYTIIEPFKFVHRR